MGFVGDDGLAHFVLVAVPVVNRGNSRDRSRNMIEKFLGHVNRNAQPRHVGTVGAPQIMQRVRLNLQRLVEGNLRF